MLYASEAVLGLSFIAYSACVAIATEMHPGQEGAAASVLASVLAATGALGPVTESARAFSKYCIQIYSDSDCMIYTHGLQLLITELLGNRLHI